MDPLHKAGSHLRDNGVEREAAHLHFALKKTPTIRRLMSKAARIMIKGQVIADIICMGELLA